MKITMMRKMRRVLRLISKCKWWMDCLCYIAVLWTSIVIHGIVASRFGESETVPVLNSMCNLYRSEVPCSVALYDEAWHGQSIWN